MKYLLLIFLSILSLNTFAAGGGSFGGGGASGDWGEQCDGQKLTYVGYQGIEYNNPLSACQSMVPYYSLPVVGVVKDGNNQGVIYTCSINSSGSYQTYVREKKSPCPTCKAGYEKNTLGQCVPKKCPVGETLINGQCKPKQCPAGQALDANGNCMPRDDQCPAGQTMVNGRCTTSPDDPDNPDSDGDGQPDLPPFCEWASVMCQWHTEWQQWSNDYNANEEKANLDREELKRLGLDSKENLVEINQKMTEQNKKLDDLKIPLDQIKQQDQQFYDELRLWLRNFNPNDGNPSDQNPSIEFPKFCDWSVQVCNWYLDWNDWRTDYTANNEQIKQRLDQHLERLQEMKEQDKQHYGESKSFFNDVRDFFAWYKDQEEEPPPDPEPPTEPEEPKPPEPDEQQRVNWQESCPITQQSQSITLEGHTTTLEGFDMSEACSMAIKMRPLILLAGALISLLIIARGHS